MTYFQYYKISNSISIPSISTNLPPTAYIKMIDIWLLFSLLKPFVDIIVQTYIETLRENPEEQKGDLEEDKKTAWPEKKNLDAMKYNSFQLKSNK